jgi:hypothetical protein
MLYSYVADRYIYMIYASLKMGNFSGQILKIFTSNAKKILKVVGCGIQKWPIGGGFKN